MAAFSARSTTWRRCARSPGPCAVDFVEQSEHACSVRTAVTTRLFGWGSAGSGRRRQVDCTPGLPSLAESEYGNSTPPISRFAAAHLSQLAGFERPIARGKGRSSDGACTAAPWRSRAEQLGVVIIFRRMQRAARRRPHARRRSTRGRLEVGLRHATAGLADAVRTAISAAAFDGRISCKPGHDDAVTCLVRRCASLSTVPDARAPWPCARFVATSEEAEQIDLCW